MTEHRPFAARAPMATNANTANSRAENFAASCPVRPMIGFSVSDYLLLLMSAGLRLWRSHMSPERYLNSLATTREQQRYNYT